MPNVNQSSGIIDSPVVEVQNLATLAVLYDQQQDLEAAIYYYRVSTFYLYFFNIRNNYFIVKIRKQPLRLRDT